MKGDFWLTEEILHQFDMAKKFHFYHNFKNFKFLRFLVQMYFLWDFVCFSGDSISSPTWGVEALQGRPEDRAPEGRSVEDFWSDTVFFRLKPVLGFFLIWARYRYLRKNRLFKDDFYLRQQNHDLILFFNSFSARTSSKVLRFQEEEHG